MGVSATVLVPVLVFFFEVDTCPRMCMPALAQGTKGDGIGPSQIRGPKLIHLYFIVYGSLGPIYRLN
jgi:hypothetical protein